MASGAPHRDSARDGQSGGKSKRLKIRKNAPRLVLRTACETLPVATRQRVLRAETKPLTTEDTEVYRGNQILGFPLYTSVSSVIKISDRRRCRLPRGSACCARKQNP